ncbi:hypothetical protein BDN72DRAFT_777997 [Pluteus cervinus]|uniref:Uncharacterized protein n=1 Tax=Pluteus cervinus TaxID=181527 RepID=A0ACD3A7Q7_9AGAR|nr:hypothetical protein BDN72DRAFT_777997 [Pluteus cervinus]
MQNIAKFNKARVSGVVSVQCARHGLFTPQGTVDLAKGEAYARTDFALVNSLTDMWRLRWIRCSYDLWCHFVIHLLGRIKAMFPSALPLFEHRVTGSIPKMHIKNHVDSCQNRWSFNFLPHSGETCGESIEATWAEQNQAAATTREMNSGHRHDALDDSFGFWNWQKVQILGNRRYRDCLVRKAKYKTDFESLTKRFLQSMPEAVAAWKKMDNGSVSTKRFSEVGILYLSSMSKFTPCLDKPPTQRSAYEALLKSEFGEELQEKNKIGGKVTFVQEGIEIELEQRLLRKLVQAELQDDTAIAAARVLLIRRIRAWRQDQRTHCPALATQLPEQSDTPEELPLLLPSSFTGEQRKELGLDDLGGVEERLRVGQCYDALDRIRLAIKTFNFNCTATQAEIFGQGPNTRAQAFLRSLKADQVDDAAVYRLGREAYVKLRYPSNDEVLIGEDPLKPLLDTELWGKDTTRQPVLGDTHRHEPWFWTVDCPPGVPPSVWSIEHTLQCTILPLYTQAYPLDIVDRVQWFRLRALLERCVEEMEILEQEILHTHKSFGRLSVIWSCIGIKETHLGARSYAYKQSAMYK